MKLFFSFLFLGFILILANASMATNGVIVVPLGDNLYVLGSPHCKSSDVSHCTNNTDCTAAGGYWWSDNACLGVSESETVASVGGRIWMDRNLGASRVATSSTDEAAYGDLYQWGRGADGHQLRTSATTTMTSSTDDPGHGDFITTDPFAIPNDWRVPQNDNLWQGISGTNNPCPDGFRPPTDTEWETEKASWSSNNSVGAFASPLKLVAAGIRDYNIGSVYHGGTAGGYWSSTVYADGTFFLAFQSDLANIGLSTRAEGFSVRCIKD